MAGNYRGPARRSGDRLGIRPGKAPWNARRVATLRTVKSKKAVFFEMDGHTRHGVLEMNIKEVK